MKVKRERCQNCKYWQNADNEVFEMIGERSRFHEIGFCKRYPPTPFYVPKTDNIKNYCIAIFPKTWAIDVCGEYVKAPKEIDKKTSIYHCGFSVRMRNVFRRMKIKTIAELTELPGAEKKLLEQRNFGQTSLRQLKRFLFEKGLQLNESE